MNVLPAGDRTVDTKQKLSIKQAFDMILCERVQTLLPVSLLNGRLFTLVRFQTGRVFFFFLSKNLCPSGSHSSQCRGRAAVFVSDPAEEEKEGMFC